MAEGKENMIAERGAWKWPIKHAVLVTSWWFHQLVPPSDRILLHMVSSLKFLSSRRGYEGQAYFVSPPIIIYFTLCQEKKIFWFFLGLFLWQFVGIQIQFDMNTGSNVIFISSMFAFPNALLFLPFYGVLERLSGKSFLSCTLDSLPARTAAHNHRQGRNLGKRQFHKTCINNTCIINHCS